MNKMSTLDGLTITAVATRTGVGVPRLRAWERRHGFPVPRRLPGGHRRYAEADVAAIEHVKAELDAGRSLEAAIALVTADGGGTDETVYAGLRRRRPDLMPRVHSRRALLALSHALEDEVMARGDRAHLVGCFQRAAVYRSARRRRWDGLSRAAESTLVFADFSRSRVAANGVREVALPHGAPQEREWAVVVDGPRAAGALAGWERPDGRFEAVWTVEPAAVRVATEVACAVAGRHAPALDVPKLPSLASDTGGDALRRAVEVAGRALAELDARSW